LLIFESILTPFKQSIVFWSCWDSIENWLEHKTEPPLGNLACPSPWNALYQIVNSFENVSNATTTIVFEHSIFGRPLRNLRSIPFWRNLLIKGNTKNSICLCKSKAKKLDAAHLFGFQGKHTCAQNQRKDSNEKTVFKDWLNFT
jgi:hypothetical protein